MSSRSISRAAYAPATNLADLLATLQACELPERKRQELASAIRTVARALARPPENIAADGRLLANRLKDVASAAIGVSRLRWNNVRSLFRTALTFVQRSSKHECADDHRDEQAISEKRLLDNTRAFRHQRRPMRRSILENCKNSASLIR